MVLRVVLCYKPIIPPLLKMTKLFFKAAVLFIAVYPAISFAQSYQFTASGAKGVANNQAFEIQFYSPNIVRVIKTPVGHAFVTENLSVIKKPVATALKTAKNGDQINLSSSQIKITLNLKSGAIAYLDKNGMPLLREKADGASFKPFDDAGNKTLTVSQSFILDKDEAIYGLGQHQRGNLSQRNQTYKNMMQGNTEDVVPFFQSVKGYGIFWDNYSPTTFSDKPEETLLSSDVGEGIDYYFMYGSNADGVIAQMRDLTGQAPMFPLWTYGFWQSKERYKTQDETVGVLKKYRELGVPIDGIVQDWQYWGNNYLWNSMEFLNVDFSNPQKMMSDIHKMNGHLMISIWSSFGPQTKPYRDMKPKNMLLDFNTWPESGSELWPPKMDYPSGVRPYDVYNPEAREIYWDYLNKGLFKFGIDGWWMDSTEPDHLSFKPTDLDLKTHLGSFRKVRNAYPLMGVGGVYDHQRKVTSDKRVFILTRSAFAGQQRYGANTWSGDITSSWETLQKQIPTGLNFSLSAIPYWNADIGGFFLSKYPRKLEDPEYRELYARWMEFGTFTPLMRSHGADAPREIYQFGKKGDKVYDAAEKYINLRYRLLPYIYSTSWDVTAHQSSMMRALFMDFSADKNVWDIPGEYMFGKSLLVNPVTSSMYTKVAGRDKAEDFGAVKSQETYLPAGRVWYDFWSGQKVAGGKKVSRETPLDIIPLYVKGGSIMPIGPKVQYSSEKNWDNMEIRVYPGADADFTLYEDENDNYNYEKGQYSEIVFHWDDKKGTLTIADRKGAFKGMLTNRTFNLTVAPAGIVTDAGKLKSVSYSGKKVSIKL
ncbi:alpha-D-xyloside xylohydrolase [Mucilaginibacter auburnensis]|uniref:Alpha-D-xyloside xylohydrolase n=2 Tax=Mucilaginibacter auburnensis TaxID=1457233 RepID=A0A2H9VNS0_9SPHI|nr:alpha-D-xyloside xylohydrolase [Mucilaginibacter auburnensis]